MVRPRTSTAPPRERAKLDTAEQVNTEIRKLYRRRSNKEITDAELKSRLGALVALRGGMPDPVEQSGPNDGFAPGIEQFNIIGIPPGWRVIGLLGAEAHVPCAILAQLRELLPPGSIGRPSSADGVLPPLPVNELPDELLCLLDGARPVDPEPPEAA